MPELPDVEVYRRIAVDTALGRPIAGVEAVEPDLLAGVTADDLRARLTGRAVHETLRHGKHLFLGTGEDGWLRLHFGMSGRLVAVAPEGALPDAADLVLRFDDGGALVYAAPRKLGAIGWVDDPAAFVRDEHLGRDAFTPRLTADALAALLADRHGMVKPALTDQHRLAGIGNVYADEALFQAGLHPRARADRLDRDQVAALADALHHVCDLAIKHGADPARLPGSWLLPHREAGAACPRCGTPLEEIKVSGRTTVFCPTCQPAG
jgi:formamidopyrimidine-DNA glycosylase